jgi:zinc transporter ZupT
LILKNFFSFSSCMGRGFLIYCKCFANCTEEFWATRKSGSQRPDASLVARRITWIPRPKPGGQNNDDEGPKESMSAAIAILIRTGAAFFIALAGGVASALMARTHKRLCALISLGAGTLLGVTVFAIAPECLEALRVWQFTLAAATGYGLFALISKYIFHVCPACAASHFDEATTHRFGEIALAMMVALAIHCTVDGLALAAGHEETGENAHTLDMTMMFAICVHKAPEGMALGALLLGAGFARMKMLWLVAAVELTTILGGFVGHFILHGVSEFWLRAALAHAGGGFLFLATHAILGEIWKHHKGIVLGFFTAGFLAVGLLVLGFHLKD